MLRSTHLLSSIIYLFASYTCFAAPKTKPSATISPSDSVRISFANTSAIIDFQNDHTAFGRFIVRHTFGTLFDLDTKGNLVPRLAETFKFDETGSKVSITLRKDIKWSDGTSIKADDFVHGFERLLDPKFHSRNSYLFEEVEGSISYYQGRTKDFKKDVGVKSLDDRTLEFRFNRSNPEWLKWLAHPATAPIHPQCVSNFSLCSKLDVNMKTSGPYVITQPKGPDESQIYILQWRTDGFPIKPKKTIQHIEVTSSKTDSDPDLSLLEEDDAKNRFSGTSDTVLSPNQIYLMFDIRRFPSSNPDFRKLLTSLNLTEEFGYHYNLRPSYQWLTGTQDSVIFSKKPDPVPNSKKEEVRNAAKALLNKMPFDATLSPQAKMLAPKIPGIEKITEKLQLIFAERLGLRLVTEIVPEELFREKVKRGEAAIILTELSPDLSITEAYFLSFLKDHPLNDIQYNNEELNEIIRELRYTITPSLRLKSISRLHDIIIKDEMLITVLGRKIARLDYYRYSAKNKWISDSYSLVRFFDF